MDYQDYYSEVDSWQFVSAMRLSLDSHYGGKMLLRNVDPLLYSPGEQEKPVKQESEAPNYLSWRAKVIDDWTPKDVLSWLCSEAQYFGVMIHEMQGHNFAEIDGHRLKQMTEKEFIALSYDYGHHLYERFLALKMEIDRPYIDPLQSYYGDDCLPVYKFENNNNGSPHYIMTNLDHENSISLDENRATQNDPFNSDVESNGSDSIDSEILSRPIDLPVKRKPGRPPGSRRKKKPEKLGRLWEFIRDLLLNPEYCPSYICWDNHDEGTFRFVHSDKVAKLWGSKKDNPDMTYEKLSRAMRYYYKSKVLQPVLGRRLVYKFGPSATGWKTQNPNFRGRG